MNLLRGILSKHWAIDRRYVDAHMGILLGIAQGNVDFDFKIDTKSEAYVISKNGARTNDGIGNASSGSIAIIEVSGPITKYDQFCGPVGTATMAQWVKDANNNPNIDGIILKVDSPGGSVDGTEEFASVISKASKPVIAFIDGLAASAGYWIASQADEIIANGRTAEVGSIGTMMSWADMKPMFEKQGVNFHEVYASKSTDKNKPFRDANNGDYTQAISELDAINAVFEDSVRSARANISNDVFSGAIYIAEKAQEMGLIDKIGTMQDAIDAISRLKKSTTMSKHATADFPNFCAILGFTDGFESNEQGVHLSLEQVQNIEASLATGATDAQRVNTLQEELNTLRSSDTQAELTTANNRIQQLEQELLESNNRRSSNGTTIETPTPDPVTTSSTQSPYVDDGSKALLEKYTFKK